MVGCDGTLVHSEQMLLGKSHEEATQLCKSEKEGEPMMMVDKDGKCSCCPIRCGPGSDSFFEEKSVQEAKAWCNSVDFGGASLHLNGEAHSLSRADEEGQLAGD